MILAGGAYVFRKVFCVQRMESFSQVIGWNVDENKLVSLLSLDEEELSYAAVAEAGDLVVFAGGRRCVRKETNHIVYD